VSRLGLLPCGISCAHNIDHQLLCSSPTKIFANNRRLPCSKNLSCSCSDESIDEIAAFLGVGDQVAALTAK
jgi:hypothetical protein